MGAPCKLLEVLFRKSPHRGRWGASGPGMGSQVVAHVSPRSEPSQHHGERHAMNHHPPAAPAVQPLGRPWRRARSSSPRGWSRAAQRPPGAIPSLLPVVPRRRSPPHGAWLPQLQARPRRFCSQSFCLQSRLGLCQRGRLAGRSYPPRFWWHPRCAWRHRPPALRPLRSPSAPPECPAAPGSLPTSGPLL